MARKGQLRRALQRAVVLLTVTGIAVSTALVAAPVERAFAAGPFGAGNLLVSTSVYADTPTISNTTVLPYQNAYNISAVSATGSGVGTVATITTGTATTSAPAFATGQSVTITGVLGATQVNGTWVIQSLPTTKTFTIDPGQSVGAYTSGGIVYQNVSVTAVATGQYPYVFNNASVDANFGITEPIVLDQVLAVTTLTSPSSQLTVPNSDNPAPNGDGLVTSFSSKSELALNQSTSGNFISFMGYHAPTAAIDVSNSNTPQDPDPTNTDTAGSSSRTGFYRDAATMDDNGNFQFSETAAYGGNNGRAAVLNEANSTLFYAGNAGNGDNPPYRSVVTGSGSQIANEATTSQSAQDSAVPPTTPYGNFNIVQLPANALPDKSTKDDNFRGLSVFNGVVYMTKGSGSNGINTVYFVDTTGNACPSGSGTPGVGLPQAGASLPASLSSWTSSGLYPQPSTSMLGLSATNPGLAPANMCVLKGLYTSLAKAASPNFPFGVWFANSTTLYVADEGTGKPGTITGTSPGPYTYSGATTANTGGLQKWSLVNGSWTLDYTLTNGLNLGNSYSVNNSGANVYPTGANNTQGGGGSPWNPATDGLRNLVGRINADGTVSIWATTSTVSGSGDQGADPNQVVGITDNLSATTLPASETFNMVLAPTFGIVYRGVSFTPNTPVPNVLPEAPWAALIPVSALSLGAGALWIRRRRRLRGALAV